MDRILKAALAGSVSSSVCVSINDPMDRILKVDATRYHRPAVPTVSINDPMDRILKVLRKVLEGCAIHLVSINDPMDRILKGMGL